MANEPEKLDKIDLKILRILQLDGRITNLQLSNQVGLSPAPTLERVKKLEKWGLIKSYHALVDETVLGIGIVAFIQVSLVRQINNSIEKFKNEISTITEISECYQVTGESDYLIKIMVKDMQAFEKLISDRLSRIEEIGQMKTMMVLSKTKDTRLIPHPYDNKA
jgi:Lrp/AsnC family leucine-responsive transcriptional regulator